MMKQLDVASYRRVNESFRRRMICLAVAGRPARSQAALLCPGVRHRLRLYGSIRLGIAHGLASAARGAASGDGL